MYHGGDGAVVGGYYLSEGQTRTLVDMLEARFDAVIRALGCERVGGITIAAHRDPAIFAELLVLKIPIRRREAV